MKTSYTIFILTLSVILTAAAGAEPQAGSFRKSTTADFTKPHKDVPPEKLGVVATYEEAKRLEIEISRIYSEIRATDLSLIQRQLLERSIKNTLTPASKRAHVSAAILERKAGTAEDVTAYQKELAVVMRESDAIVANARDMLQSLIPEPTEEQQQQDNRETITEPRTKTASMSQQQRAEQIEQLTRQADQKIEQTHDSLETALKKLEQAQVFVQEKKEQLAKEARERKANADTKEETPEEKKEHQEKQAEAEKLEKVVEEAEDVVKTAIEAVKKEAADTDQKIEKAKEVIRKLAEALQESTEAKRELATAKEKKAESKTDEAVAKLKEAEAAMKEAAAKLEAAKQMAAEKLSGNQQVAKIQALENLSRAGAGKFLDISDQMKGANIHFIPKAVIEKRFQPPPIDTYFKGASGRKIVASGGRGAVWFYLDDWYLIGPYDNAKRKNIETVFPPQSIVDLDATYFGKEKRQIKWQYDSFNTPMVWPGFVDEYTIYYGYTELWCYKAMDLWIAVGSDDRSDLWINGMPVWRSSNVLKCWYIGEGYRKVHFKQGRNDILFRLENGWRDLGMSVLVCTHDPRKTMQ